MENNNLQVFVFPVKGKPTQIRAVDLNDALEQLKAISTEAYTKVAIDYGILQKQTKVDKEEKTKAIFKILRDVQRYKIVDGWNPITSELVDETLLSKFKEIAEHSNNTRREFTSGIVPKVMGAYGRAINEKITDDSDSLNDTAPTKLSTDGPALYEKEVNAATKGHFAHQFVSDKVAEDADNLADIVSLIQDHVIEETTEIIKKGGLAIIEDMEKIFTTTNYIQLPFFGKTKKVDENGEENSRDIGFQLGNSIKATMEEIERMKDSDGDEATINKLEQKVNKELQAFITPFPSLGDAINAANGDMDKILAIYFQSKIAERLYQNDDLNHWLGVTGYEDVSVSVVPNSLVEFGRQTIAQYFTMLSLTHELSLSLSWSPLRTAAWVYSTFVDYDNYLQNREKDLNDEGEEIEWSKYAAEEFTNLLLKSKEYKKHRRNSNHGIYSPETIFKEITKTLLEEQGLDQIATKTTISSSRDTLLRAMTAYRPVIRLARTMRVTNWSKKGIPTSVNHFLTSNPTTNGTAHTADGFHLPVTLKSPQGYLFEALPTLITQDSRESIDLSKTNIKIVRVLIEKLILKDRKDSLNDWLIEFRKDNSVASDDLQLSVDRLTQVIMNLLRSDWGLRNLIDHNGAAFYERLVEGGSIFLSATEAHRLGDKEKYMETYAASHEEVYSLQKFLRKKLSDNGVPTNRARVVIDVKDPLTQIKGIEYETGVGSLYNFTTEAKSADVLHLIGGITDMIKRFGLPSYEVFEYSKTPTGGLKSLVYVDNITKSKAVPASQLDEAELNIINEAESTHINIDRIKAAAAKITEKADIIYNLLTGAEEVLSDYLSEGQTDRVFEVFENMIKEKMHEIEVIRKNRDEQLQKLEEMNSGTNGHVIKALRLLGEQIDEVNKFSGMFDDEDEEVIDQQEEVVSAVEPVVNNFEVVKGVSVEVESNIIAVETQHIVETTVEPVVETVVETVVEPVVETVVEAVVEPVVETVVEAVVEQTTEE